MSRMIFNDGITFQERQLIVQLRERVRNELPPSEFSKSKEDQDLFLVRWIRARENNLEKATDMLLKSLAWRRAHNVDNVLDVEPHKWFQKNFHYSMLDSTDKMGHPLMLFPFGQWGFRDAAKPNLLPHFEVHVNQLLENCVRRIQTEHESRSEGHPPITQFVFLVDCKDFSYGHLLSLGAIKIIIKLGATYEAHYPEVLYKALFFNCPSYFGTAMALVRPILAPKTLAKLSFYPSLPEWAKEDFVDSAVIPEQLGGTAGK